jgi:23S rRNA pseudouridine1911/1915/1917 synthase
MSEQENDTDNDIEWTFPLEMPGERVDKALAAAWPNISRVQWQKWLEEGVVLINGQPAKPKQKLIGGEWAWVQIPPTQDVPLVAENIPLDILYEDDDLLVINKPAGLVVHPAFGHESGTLVNAIMYHCPEVLSIGGERRPGIVHRLDKDTSGLIIIAKNDPALRHLQDQFKARTVDKNYLALVDGQIRPPQALIDAPIGRDPKQRKQMAVITGSTSATSKPAQTRFETVELFEDHTLVKCQLLTGRTHQIRVHLAYIGFPIVGDEVYGWKKPSLKLGRHFLHAAELKFNRPSDNQELSFTAALPPELERALTQLRAKLED